MARSYFSRGCKGMIAKRIQTDLQRLGFAVGDPLRFADGDFGGKTHAAVQSLQGARNLPVTGVVDGATWQQLTPEPLPSLFNAACRSPPPLKATASAWRKATLTAPASPGA